MLNLTPNRRTFLTATASMAAATALPIASDLARLIQAHRDATAALDSATSRLEDLEEAFVEFYGDAPELANLFGERPVVPSLYFRDVENEVHDCLRDVRSSCIAARDQAIGSPAEQAAIDRRYWENTAIVENAVAAIASEKERFGLTAARQRETNAYEEMDRILVMICACPCETPADAVAKAQYLEETKALDDGLRPELLAALVNASVIRHAA